MGIVTIGSETTKEPISMIGKYAGTCWGASIDNEEKNYKRGIDCLEAGHGRTFEFPDVYMTLDGYSARVIREWYTHIGGSPTRLQASTRYINYDNFDYVIPPSITKDQEKKNLYERAINSIKYSLHQLEKLNTPREDIGMLLPLGMTTKIVCKHNLRNLMDMSRQRMCSRAYWEYRQLFSDLCNALSEYSLQWKYLINNYFKPKCEVLGGCPENKSCGRMPPLN